MIWAKSNRRNPAVHDRQKYHRRYLVERLFNKLNTSRQVDTCYDKTKETYLNFVAFASIKLGMPLVHEI